MWSPDWLPVQSVICRKSCSVAALAWPTTGRQRVMLMHSCVHIRNHHHHHHHNSVSRLLHLPNLQVFIILKHKILIIKSDWGQDCPRARLSHNADIHSPPRAALIIVSDWVPCFLSVQQHVPGCWCPRPYLFAVSLRTSSVPKLKQLSAVFTPTLQLVKPSSTTLPKQGPLPFSSSHATHGQSKSHGLESWPSRTFRFRGYESRHCRFRVLPGCYMAFLWAL